MVTSRYQFKNLKFVYLIKKHANRTPTFGNSSGIHKTAEGSSGIKYLALGLATETISVLRNFL